MSVLGYNIMPHVLGGCFLSFRVVTCFSICSREANIIARCCVSRVRKYIVLASECLEGYPAKYPVHPYTWPTLVVVFDFRHTFCRWYEVFVEMPNLKYSTIQVHLVKVIPGETSVIKDGLDLLCDSLGEYRLRSIKIVLYFPSTCLRLTVFSIAHHILHARNTCVECVWRKATLTRRALVQ